MNKEIRVDLKEVTKLFFVCPNPECGTEEIVRNSVES